LKHLGIAGDGGEIELQERTIVVGAVIAHLEETIGALVGAGGAAALHPTVIVGAAVPAEGDRGVDRDRVLPGGIGEPGRIGGDGDGLTAGALTERHGDLARGGARVVEHRGGAKENWGCPEELMKSMPPEAFWTAVRPLLMERE
jgi:hypothetical protein